MVTECFVLRPNPKRLRGQESVRKITSQGNNFPLSGRIKAVLRSRGSKWEISAMKAGLRFARSISHARRASALGVFLTIVAGGSAEAAATPEQRKACTPDVYRLCPGEIPNVRAITACLRRQKASLSEACRAVFEQ
jgi:hypothetical protein